MNVYERETHNLGWWYSLVLVFLENTIGVEHGSILHFLHIGAWLRSLTETDGDTITQHILYNERSKERETERRGRRRSRKRPSCSISDRMRQEDR